ncbi:MAG: penicillin-binding protein 1B, partial [Thiothrix sp.]
WEDLFRVLPTKPLQVAQSSRLVWVDIDQNSGLRFNGCGTAVRMPFIKGSQPQTSAPCALPPEATPANTGFAPPTAPPSTVPSAPAPARKDPSSWIDNLMQ